MPRKWISNSLLLDAQQFFRLGPEAFHLGVVLLAFLHPLHGFGVPIASFVFLAELPVGHSKEEGARPVAGVVGIVKADRFLQISDSTSPITATKARGA